jgi:cytosine/uracil/thiamine/allantoin permease
VEDAAGARAEIANRHVAAHAWYALEGSLAPWAGQAVNLLLVTDVGEKNDSSGDWGAWAELRLEWQ